MSAVANFGRRRPKPWRRGTDAFLRAGSDGRRRTGTSPACSPSQTCARPSRGFSNGAKLRVMNRILPRLALAVAASLASASCDQLSQLGIGPPPAVSAPAAPPPAPPVLADLRPHAGQFYTDFAAAEGARYSPEQIGLNAADRARLWRALATATPGRLEQGGGAEALVFRGCAETSCEDGRAVVAIDTSTGAVFAAVRDAGGAEVLTPNDRVEALLRLNSPSRAWDDPAPMQTASTETANP